jgi:sulfite reductase alpha subunit-like flavoprotein
LRLYALLEAGIACFALAIPLEHFINTAPYLQPRYYTISSSSSVHPQSIHITVAVTRDEVRPGRVHLGVCSSYLAGLRAGQSVRVFVRPSGFRLPASPSTPVILVGPIHLGGKCPCGPPACWSWVAISATPCCATATP